MMFMKIWKTNQTKNRRVLIMFYKMKADMEPNKKLSPINTN